MLKCLSLIKFYFPLFWRMVMYDNEFQSKENKIKPRIKLNHNRNKRALTRSGSSTCTVFSELLEFPDVFALLLARKGVQNFIFFAALTEGAAERLIMRDKLILTKFITIKLFAFLLRVSRH